jgi:hypothetical protein
MCKFVCYFGILTITLYIQSAMAETLCAQKETVFFSCHVSPTKILSVCGNLSKEPYLQYRFGKLQNIELVFPSSKEDSLSKFEFNYIHESTSGLTTYELSFVNAGYKYVISTYGMDMTRLEPGASFTNMPTITISSPEMVKEKIMTCTHNKFIVNLHLLEYHVR